MQDAQNNVLQRCFLITFTYSLRKFPGGPQQEDGQFRNRIPSSNKGEGGGNHGGGFGSGNTGGGFRRGGN